jgi:AP-3 complex subunit delta-1
LDFFLQDLSSNNYLETSLALGCLAQIVTPDLARTLLNDLLNMLNNSRPYIRKRVVLLLYKVFLKYPEALRIAFPRLREKLDDTDQAVVSATVNVICDLAFHNPKNYIVLAPQLYGLLTNSSNNWMLIKIVKLVSSFARVFQIPS